MFSHAIVKQPCKNLIHGLTTSDLGIPDYPTALAQHEDYVQALKECGMDVIVLSEDEDYPDSTFIEDTALLTPYCAILMNPGADSRCGEIQSARRAIEPFYSRIEEVKSPGTAEAGDILMVDDHYYIGLTSRTNPSGAAQVIDILQKHGLTGSTINLNEMLHLKTGVAYLENNNLVVTGELLSEPEFDKFNKVIIPVEENYAANCIWINGTVLLPRFHPVAANRITGLGYHIIELDMTEFRKLDGGLSCLSLRF